MASQPRKSCGCLSLALLVLVGAAALAAALWRFRGFARALPLRAAWQARVASQAAGAPAVAARAASCGVAALALGAPALPLPGNCSRAPAYLADPSNYLPYFHYPAFDRYRIIKYLSAALAQDGAAAPPLAGARLVVIDESEFDDAYICLSMHRSLHANGSDDWANYLPALQRERAARVRAALDGLAPGQRAAVTYTQPMVPWERVPLAHPAQVRLVVDIDAVPEDELAAGARHFVVVPYAMHEVSGVVEAPAPRPKLVFVVASCASGEFASPGMRLRSALIDALEALADARVDARCQYWARDATVSQEEYRGRVGRATFCPLIAGDSPSTTRLSEPILLGCVPVIVGPPWPLIPLLQTGAVPWAKIALFVEMTNTSAWARADDVERFRSWQWDESGPALRATLAPGQLLRAADAADFVRQLADVPPARVAELREAALPFRKLFVTAVNGSREGGRQLLAAVCDAVASGNETA
jgi:hypothetical protein